MIRICSRVSAFTLLVLSLSAAAAAQQPAAPPPSSLVLQVVYFEGAPTSFQLVSRGPEMAWTWFGRFRTIPRPAGAAGAPPVQAVKVSSRAEGEGVRIEVAVFTGERHFDREEPVATYTTGVGDEVVVKELERFGVAPFRLTVRRLKPETNAPPVVVNKTQSVEAAITDFDSSKGVSGRLTLRNLSAKRVRAVEVRETREGRIVWTRFATEKEGRPLLEPGSTHTSSLSQTHRGYVSPEGFYVPLAAETILVASAVFEDGTFEGEPQAAARSAGDEEGERVQLTRALALLRKAPAGPGAAARLRAQVAALGVEADAPAVESIVKRYPGLGAGDREMAKSAAEVSMHTIRKELLDELAALEKEGAADGKLDEWLAAKREKFEGWLSRLPTRKE